MTRTSALLACVAGLALIAGPATAADPAAVIIDRYVAWRGGPAFERATGVHATGTATDGRFGGPVERWITSGRGRDRFAFGALTSDSAYGPDGAWTVTLSGQIEAPAAPGSASPPPRLSMARRFPFSMSPSTDPTPTIC